MRCGRWLTRWALLIAVVGVVGLAPQTASAASAPAAGVAGLTDGCSRSFDFPGGYGFKRWCNFHDRCYGSYHSFKRSWKDRCDRAFYLGLYHRVCPLVKNTIGCRALAFAYYRGVRNYFGNKAYRAAQTRGSSGNRPGYA